MTTTMPAISVHQPWAWAIAYAGKAIENRGWATSHRGLTAIHATRKWDKAAGWHPILAGLVHEDSPQITYGAVIAVADLVGCHLAIDVERCGPPDELCSPSWAFAAGWHWELDNVRPLRQPVPCKGRQRLWRLPTGVDADVRAQLTPDTARSTV